MAPWRQFAPDAHGTDRFGLMLVGEAPGRVSCEHGRPFANPNRPSLRRALAGLDHPTFRDIEDLFYLTDVVKCHPAGPSGANRSPRAAEVRTCTARYLAREIAALQPRHVLTVGRLAAEAVVGRRVRLRDIHGHVRHDPRGFDHLPLAHPSRRNGPHLIALGFAPPERYEEYLATVFARITQHVAD